MARTFTTGFELNESATNPIFETRTGAGTTYDTSIVRTGTYSLKVAKTSGVANYLTVNGMPTTGYLRFYLRMTALPGVEDAIMGNNNAGQIRLGITAAGLVTMYVQNTLIGTSTTALTDTARWYRIEVRQANGTSVTVLQIDGNAEITGTPSSWTFSPQFGCLVTPAATTYTAYYDDLVVDGAGFPGEGRVVLLKPISDNARATLWTGGAGGTTNLFEAVNNTPPIGTATETDLTQIEHAGNSAGTTDAYDANMTSYATAGLYVGDVVNMVCMMAVDGEDSGTGSKLLAYSVVSNPAIASPGNVTAGDDAGALGTYGLTWAGRNNRGVTTSPTVTINTSPVMRVVRPETATRVASVCLMAMYVEYTPGNRYPRQVNSRNIQQSTNRSNSY